MLNFNPDIEACLDVLHNGGLILYPTDTVWGIGCDSTNEDAVKKVFQLKKRHDSKALIVLVADEREVLRYVAHPDPSIFDFLSTRDRPTTVIYDGAIGLADNLVADDGSIAIRISRDEFCRHLLKRFRKPIVSTSANISGTDTPASFRFIQPEIIKGVDHVVRYRQDDEQPARHSSIVQFKKGKPFFIRQ